MQLFMLSFAQRFIGKVVRQPAPINAFSKAPFRGYCYFRFITPKKPARIFLKGHQLGGSA